MRPNQVIQKSLSLKMLPNVNNFRDLASACRCVNPGLISRCACPVHATEAEMRLLRERGITTMVDLRSDEEIREFGQAPIMAGATMVTHLRSSSWFHSAKMEKVTEKMGGQPEHEPFTLHHVSILNRRRFYWAVAQRLPFKVIGSAMLMSLWNLQGSNDMLIGEINTGGLNWLYEILLDTSPLEFGAALKEISATLEKGECVMVFCKAGKDRTGLVVMLLLHVAGATEEEIVEDYHRSDGYHHVALGGLEKKEELQKLDTATFSRAPKDAMQHAINYLKRRFGSIENYLVKCDFSTDEQAQLKALLTSDQSATSAGDASLCE